MSVGIIAVKIAATTRIEYCSLLMIAWVKPYSAEMVPKVRPVLIIKVVYRLILVLNLNSTPAGYRPKNFARLFDKKNTMTKATLANTAFRFTRLPAFRK